MMDVRALHDDRDYDWALQEIGRYFETEPQPGTADADRFDVISALIEVYEARRFTIPAADPIDVLNFAIDHLGRTQSDLAGILGSRSRASEILSRQRPLTLPMIRSISAAWRLPLESLAQSYPLARSGVEA